MFNEELIIDDQTGGINSKKRSTKIKDNQMVSIVGYDFDADSLRRAKGYTKLGTEADVSLTGKTLYKHEVLTGTDVLVKSIGTLLKYYDTVDDEWYLLTDATFTTGLIWTFSSFNGFLSGNNGTDDWVFWAGSAQSTLDGDIAIGAIAIDLASGEGARFGSSGTVMIQGEAIAFSGRSTDQLTGVTGVLTEHLDGSTVITELDSTTYSSLSQAKQGKYTSAVHSNRRYYIDADNPRKILHSKLADNTNPETDMMNFTVLGSGSGDAGFGFAPDEIVAIIEYTNANQSSILASFCKNGKVYAFTVTDGTSTTVNAYITIRTMNSYPINPQMVTVAENDLAIVDQLKHARTLAYGDVNTPLTTKSISKDIEPSLEASYWTDGCMDYFNRKLIVGGSTLDGGTNDIYYYHDSNYNAWGAYGHWDAIDFAEYNAEFYCLSSISGDVFKLFDGYSAYVNDATANYEVDYRSDATTKAFNFGLPHIYKQALLLRMDGFISTLAEVYFDVYFDGVKFATYLIAGSNEDIQGSLPNVGVGTIVFGQGVFGKGLGGGSLRREFVTQLALPEIKNFLKVQFRLRMDGQNVDFEMTNLTIWAKLLGKEDWLPKKEITQS